MNCELLKETRKQAEVTQEAMAKKLGYKGKGSYCLLGKRRREVHG